jgi:hypothetical protein
VAEHDDAAHGPAELGVAEQRAEPEREVRAEVGAARDLGDEGGAQGARERLGLVAGGVPGHDDGARLGVDLEADGSRTRRDGPGAGVDELGTGIGQGAERSRQRLAERDVEVHRAGHGGGAGIAVGVGRAEGGGDRAQGDGSDALGVDRPGQRGLEVTAPTHGDAEQAGLLRGLVGADAPQLDGPVGGEHDHRDAAVVGLEHRGVQVGHGRAGGGHDDGGHARLDGEAECEEACGALVDAHPEAEATGPLELGGGEGQRLGAGTGAEHDLADPGVDERREDGDGPVGRDAAGRRGRTVVDRR